MEDREDEPPRRRRAQTIVALVLFGLALVVIRREISAYSAADLVAALEDIGGERLALSLGFAVLNYLALTGYDALALHVVGQRLTYARIALVSFVAYAFSHNVGLSFVGGGAVRFRFYASWGLAADRIAAVVALNLLTFWLGFLLLLGVTLALLPPPLPGHTLLPASLGFWAGVACLVLVAGYLVAVGTRRAPLRIGGRDVPLPSPTISCLQIALSAIDWLLAAAVLYPLLPLGDLPFVQFVGIFLGAQIVAQASHVPGGVGVFEGVMLLSVGTEASRAALLGGLIAYRVIYYLLPFVLSVGVLAGLEAVQRAQVWRAGHVR